MEESSSEILHHLAVAPGLLRHSQLSHRKLGRAKERHITPSVRQDAMHAFRLLNFFVGDLVAASQVRRLFQLPSVNQKASSTTVACVNRMCLAYLFLTLDKWNEFYRRFHHVLPSDCRLECKRLLTEVQRRKINRFRNTFVGHIWDKRLNRPLTPLELEAAVGVIVEGDQDTFVQWCNNHEVNEYPKTIVSIIEHTRDRIREEFNLRDEDLFPSESPPKRPMGGPR